MTRFALEAMQQEAQRAIASEGLRPFTRRTGLAMGLVRSLADGRDLSVSSALAVADALGYDVFAQPKRFSGGFSEDESDVNLGDKNALRSGFLPIPWHEATGLRGSAPVAFSATWLASEGLSPDFLKAVVPTATHFSMGDPKNTVALLDTSAAQVGSDAQWCYVDGKEVILSRIAFDMNVVVLFASAQSGPVRIVSRPLPQGFRLLGKVAWLGLLPKE